MIPSVCPVCGISVVENPDGEWLKFLDYKILNDGLCHSEDGVAWFCSEHIEEAKLLSSKKVVEAIAILRNAIFTTE